MPRVRVSTQPAPPGTAGSEPNALLDTRVRAVGADLIAAVTLTRDEIPRGDEPVTYLINLRRADLLEALRAGGDD